MASSKQPPAKKQKTEKLKSPSAKVSESTFYDSIVKDRIETSPSIMEFSFNKKRIKVLSEATSVSDSALGILYWMSRDQRVNDNWAMLYAQKLALKNKLPLHVCFCLVPTFLDATIRHYDFLLKGLEEVSSECQRLNIRFHLLLGPASQVLPSLVQAEQLGAVVADFSPLREPKRWVEDVKKALPADVPLCQVDAHNIVPCWVASEKLEYAARTIRNKINSKLPEFLTHFPPVIPHPHPAKSKAASPDWQAAKATLDVDQTVLPVKWAQPGTKAGMQVLESFCRDRLKLFGAKRNDPTIDALSNLSPWFHFGQVSVQRAVLCVKQSKNASESVASFCEEAIVRRELSDNFCHYNALYDSLQGASAWAQTSLQLHAADKRDYLYTRADWQAARTHDDLWNAAQIQLSSEGKMHGFLRMYWAKKILEWSATPQEALATAIYLNDRYSLDGRDPNGFVGSMWSICGIHDMGWAERPVFGKIRYMNYQGCKRKFDVQAFVARYGGKVHLKKKNSK